MISFKTEKWQISNIDTVLFDKDGTFIDLHHFWGKMTELRSKEIIKRYNLQENYFEKLCLYLGYDINSKKMLDNGITALYSRIKIIKLFKEKLLDININISTEELTQIFDYVNAIFYKDMIKYTKPINEAIDFIKELRKKNIKIGIVTSDSLESTNLTIKNFNWEKLFDIAVGRECSTQTKESGALSKIALEKLNSKPETTLMIGDAPMDYLAAKNAGINNIILCATGQLSKEKLLKTTKFTVKTLSEIKLVNS